jgi:3',5'-cyclic AMP phosphodiesterase CpdA
MTYTLLHISDLHRAQADPIGNAELLSTLLADRDRAAQENPPIGSPDAIVVTGDLVQGARLGLEDYGAELDAQYEVATDFLIRLADEFLDGDRARMVILPGNHDVDWNGAKAAMQLIADEDVPSRFLPAMCGPSSDWRWSWDDRRVYRIVDRAHYDTRLARFDRLVDSFYADVDIMRTPLFRVHPLHDGRIALVAFDSCFGNDCFAFHGQIDEDAMALAHLDLRGQPFELCIAAWHHSIEGDPAATDYMSVSTVEGLIGKGFRLGLHGHQHRAAASTRYIHLPHQEVMAVISAGSLCAGARNLPTGVNRQYNLIEIADDLCSARVHVREMAIAHNFAPARRPEFGFLSYIDLKWKLPDLQPRPQPADSEQALTLDAEQAITAGRFEQAERALGGVSTEPGSYPRSLLVTALQEQHAWDRLAEFLAEPSSIHELVAATNALVELGDYDHAEGVLDRHRYPLQMPVPIVEDLRALIAAKRVLN